MSVDRAQALTDRLSTAERDRTHGPVPIRDAASLIILDAEGGTVLMGRRSQKHVFMPGRFVFPGGRVDPTDSRVPVAADFCATTAQKLSAETGRRTGSARVKAFGVAALREAYEETGVLIGRRAEAVPTAALFRAFADHGLALDLSLLTFVARAITPPGRPRRYDTRFFVVQKSAVVARDETVTGPDAELEEVAWVPIEEARALPLPTITLTVLDELTDRLEQGQGFDPAGPVPFYRWQRSAFVRTVL
ncbi:MAG: NUDIX hydrolase [Pseudomonadota bacterium]